MWTLKEGEGFIRVYMVEKMALRSICRRFWLLSDLAWWAEIVYILIDLIFLFEFSSEVDVDCLTCHQCSIS